MLVTKGTHFLEWGEAQLAAILVNVSTVSDYPCCQASIHRMELLMSCHYLQQSAQALLLMHLDFHEEYHPDKSQLRVISGTKKDLTASCQAQVPNIRFGHTQSFFPSYCM